VEKVIFLVMSLYGCTYTAHEGSPPDFSCSPTLIPMIASPPQQQQKIPKQRLDGVIVGIDCEY
jgi:hypothetical protein